MNTTPQPPQGVMAELRDLLMTDWHDISDEQVRTMHRALPGLLHEVEALRADADLSKSMLRDVTQTARTQRERASALLARCEGLEAALREAFDAGASAGHWAGCNAPNDYLTPTDTRAAWNDFLADHPQLAATRTTGD